MARVLLTWELGGNYGHLGRQLPIAQALRAAGHDVLFATRDTRIAARLLKPHGFAYVQVPILANPVRLKAPPATYAELLLAEGYGDVESLGGRIDAWLRLFEAFKPRALVVDHSPTALLAARCASLPAVHVGHGFEIPPPTTPLPVIRDWEPVDSHRVQRSESRVLDTVNAVLAPAGSRLGSLAELFAWSRQILATFRELDPFPVRGEDSYAGALFGELGSGARDDNYDIDDGNGHARRTFAYLHDGTPGLRALVQALAARREPTTCVVPGLRARTRRKLSTDTLELTGEHRSLGPILRHSNLVVCAGGIGVLSQSLLAGVPVLLLPSTVEQYLAARRVEQAGAGICVGRDRRASTLGEALTRLSQEPRYGAAASAFARRYQGFEPGTVVAQAAATVTELTQLHG